VSAVPSRFTGWHAVGDLPHIVVDSYPVRGTVICLSHWPSAGSGLVARGSIYRADTSTEIVWKYLNAGGGTESLPVTSPHFDADGLFAAYLLTAREPVDDTAARLLIEAAAVGDFAVPRSEKAIRLSHLIDHWCDDKAGPMAGDLQGRPRSEQHRLLFERLLVELPGWLCNFPAYEAAFWDSYRRTAEAQHRLLDSRGAVLRSSPGRDLAWLALDGPLPEPSNWPYFGFDPIVIHERAGARNILLTHGERFRLVQRYEGWVRLEQKPECLRPDLFPLTDGGGMMAGCAYDGVHQMIPTLQGEFRGDAGELNKTVAAFIEATGECWNPYT
jgi:hypothetical protein